VPGGAVSEGPAAGTDALLPVLPATAPLSDLFAPTSDQGWLSVGAGPNGVVPFSFAANTDAPRTGHLSVLGQSITVTQQATPAFSNLSAPAVTYGAATTSIAGRLGTGAPLPTGSVTISLGDMQQTATVQSDGRFAASFDTHALPVRPGGYPIGFAYAGDRDYGSASASSTLTVTPATLTITPGAYQAKAYGAAVPGLTYTASGFVNGDPASTLTGALGTAATAASPVGSYAFTLGALSAGGNYTVALAANPPPFTVTKAALTITANNQSKITGEANPAFTVRDSGFVLGQNASVLGGTLTCSTPATAGSPPGTYAITPGGLTSGNYALTFVSGTLTVLSYGQATRTLQAQVDAAGLAPGIQSSLDRQLQAAIADFAAGDTADGVGQLGAFINHVRAQRGNQIGAALADAWIASAQRILNAAG
jgi:hypothetical protein